MHTATLWLQNLRKFEPTIAEGFELQCGNDTCMTTNLMILWCFLNDLLDYLKAELFTLILNTACNQVVKFIKVTSENWPGWRLKVNRRTYWSDQTSMVHRMCFEIFSRTCSKSQLDKLSKPSTTSSKSTLPGVQRPSNQIP